MTNKNNEYQWQPKKYLVRISIYLIILMCLQISLGFYLSYVKDSILTVFGCLLAGGVGGTVYCLRAVYIQACVKKEWDENWVVWYIVRPLISIVIGGVSYLFIKAGLVLFNSSGQSEVNQLSIWSLAFLSGFNVDNFIKKIESIGETVWGISPSKSSNNKGVSNE